MSLNPRWVDGLCGLATTYFNMKQYRLALKYITLAKDNWKGQMDGDEKKTIMLDFETVSFITAMCLKMTGHFERSGKAYRCLEVNFRQKRLTDLANYFFGLILIPLQEDRKLMADHLENVQEIVEYMQDAPKMKQDNQTLFLSKYCILTKGRG